MEVAQMTDDDRKINIRCQELLGYPPILDPVREYWDLADFCNTSWYRLLEDNIRDLGLCKLYTTRLEIIILKTIPDEVKEYGLTWLCMHADPRYRAMAYIQAVSGEFQ